MSSLRAAVAVIFVFVLCMILAAPAVAQDEQFHSDAIARFHINNGKYLIDRGEFMEANAEFETALEVAQAPALKAESHAWLAQLSATFLDDVNAAMDQYQLVVRDFPTTEFYRTSLYQLGMLQYQQQRLKEARATLHLFQRDFPEDAQAMTVSYILQQIEKYLLEKTVPPLPPMPVIGKTIRVHLASTREARISAGGKFVAKAAQHVFSGEIGFTARDGHVVYGTSDLGAGPVELTSEQPFVFQGRRYRGSFLLSANKSEVMVVNQLPIEAYLWSVVASEMSPSWPLEALKAQAVAARTYAAYAIAHPIRGNFDLYDDVRSQAYNGVGNELDTTRKAVDATVGIVLSYQGRPIIAYFMANNGGRMNDSKGAFGVEKPYFQVADDPFSKLEPLGHWERNFRETEIRNALVEFGFQFPNAITAITVFTKDESGRAGMIDVTSGDHTIRMRCRNQFRLAINRYVKTTNSPENIPDTLLDIKHDETGAVYTIGGGGWGHGVGLSQHGAKARAKAGQDFTEILRAYYPQTEQTKLY